MKTWIPTLATGALFLALPASASELTLTDEATQIGGIRTIFIDDVTLVTLDGLEWDGTEKNGNTTTLLWETTINGVTEVTGSLDLADGDLPTSLDAGPIVATKRGTSTVSVTYYMEGTPEEDRVTFSEDYQTYGRGASLVPLILILILAFLTGKVELSLFLGIWLGCCLLTGSIADGFTTTLIEFLIGALADEGHVFVILFSLFLSGLVGMLQKSGGMLGFTNGISKIAKTPRAGQFATLAVGVIIFFDDYANLLLTGESMKPLLDVLFVSREKLSFIVDATAAPIASISPVSSWVGFEASLIQEAIDELQARGTELTIPDTGFGVYLESIRYSYYSLFMIGLIFMLIATQRDYGPMLVAERKVRVYDRKDGGDGAARGQKLEGTEKLAPQDDQPLMMHNMLIPIVVLIIIVFVLLANTGATGEDQTFLEKIEGGDSYVALLYGTMGTAWITILLYLLQITVPGTGKLALPTPAVIMDMMPWSKKDEQPRFILSIGESIEAFLYGMERIFLAIVILTLAWASGAVMVAVGADRLFSAAITGGTISYQVLPVLTFLMASLMAIATGTSWGTMGILFPLILVPTYEASDGDPQIFYATVSAVLGGAVAGDHCSPISDTTVLSSLACDVTLMGHVNTQAPYVVWVLVFAMLFGYIPAGYGAYPNIVGILLGWAACALFVFFVCVPVLSPTGKWDFITTLFCGRSKELQDLAADCAKKVAGESPESPESDKEKQEPEEAPDDIPPAATDEKSM